MTSLTQRVVLLLFASGFCSLVYQMAWLRLLRLVFGASTAASAAVLAIFMGGLGLGSLLLGPRADRVRNPLALYARLEIGISIAAGVSPLLIAAVRAAYIGVGGTDALGGFGGTAMRLVLSALVLGVPTFLMGGTLPATVRAVTRAGDVGRRTVGLLYAVNTLGAVSGTVATVFWAIEMLGISRTVWVAALLNLLVAVSARALSRSWASEIASREGRQGSRRAGEEGTGPSAEADAPEPTPRREDGAPPRPVPLGFILAAAAIVGFAFFLMELVWYRMLAPILGGTSYTFGSILAVALAGIGTGGLLYALGRRERPPTLLGFGATCALEALLLIIPFALGDRLAFLALALQGLDPVGFGGLIVEWTAVTTVVVLPPALVAGYQFPLLVGLVGRGRRHLGREVGATYAWNTLGAIAGSVAGGFGLLPLLTAPGTWRWTTVGLALLAAAAVALGRSGSRGRVQPAGGTVPVVLLALVALLLAATPGPSAFWRHSGIGGRRADRDLDGPNAVRAAVRDARDRLIWEAEGRESSVSLIHGNGYTFMVNGKTDGSALGDAPTQVMSGLIGAMLHPDPRRALVIGLGTGSTAGWLAALPGMERVDVVELEPAVIRVAEACAEVNRRVLERDNVNLIVGDGREFLLTTDRRYDVIFSEPSNPYRAGISSLFTREFYRAAVERLAADGLFIQWLQGYEVDASVVRTAYGTLASVFPAVESWQVDTLDLLLVAGREPVTHDWARVAARAAREPYETALERVWGVRGAAGFYSGFLGGPGLARAMAEARARRGEPLNTDDHPVIEYGFVRNLGRKGLFEIDELADLARGLGVDRPVFAEPPGSPAPDWHAVEEAASARGIFLQAIPDPSPSGGYPGVGSRVLARRSFLDERLPAALAAWEGQDREPEQPADLLLVAESMAVAGADRAPEAAERLRPMLPGAAEAVLARYRYETGELARATTHLESFFEVLREEPWLPAGLEHRVLQLADWLGQEDRGLALRLFEATERPFAAGVAERNRRVLRLRLAASAGFEEHCVEAYEALEPHVPWEGPTLNNRMICYRENDHRLLERAREELAAWNRGEPPRLDAGIE